MAQFKTSFMRVFLHQTGKEMAEHERFLLKVPVARLLSEGKSDEVGGGNLRTDSVAMATRPLSLPRVKPERAQQQHCPVGDHLLQPRLRHPATNCSTKTRTCTIGPQNPNHHNDTQVF